jgi:hypothetical protein
MRPLAVTLATVVPTWVVVWVTAILAMLAVVRVVDPPSIDPGEVQGGIQTFAGLGLFAGVLFTALVTIAERRRPLADLAWPRAALWGAIAAAPWPFFSAASDSMALILCPLGALAAVASRAVARTRAQRRAAG